MHSACRAPGDCLQIGPDPPESVTVLLDTELGDGAALGDPLLKLPQSYDLLWADDAARPERRLAFWQPVPYEGCELDLGFSTAAGWRLPAPPPWPYTGMALLGVHESGKQGTIYTCVARKLI